ncbi:TCF3 fusion partner isoform X1 [Orcinus orca]|uniref:TCF3 fusion partner isoform X1 n=1 Tax=Orcinus orca TaxID=9733 RepID=UPI0014414E2D|nr:TCF3 fusion partner isoform X1 [Orcinus orca]
MVTDDQWLPWWIAQRGHLIPTCRIRDCARETLHPGAALWGPSNQSLKQTKNRKAFRSRHGEEKAASPVRVLWARLPGSNESSNLRLTLYKPSTAELSSSCSVVVSGPPSGVVTSRLQSRSGGAGHLVLPRAPLAVSSACHPGVSDLLGPGQPWLQSELGCRGPPSQPPEDKAAPRRLLSGRRFLMRVLDSYGDDYRASQFTIVLEDEGSQGTDAPTPGNAENEPPEKEGLSPPRRTPAPPEPGSPAPGEGPSGRKRRRAPRDGRRVGAALTPELAPVQIKVEEDFGFEADEALDSSWVSRGPDKLLPYPTLASPAFD